MLAMPRARDKLLSSVAIDTTLSCVASREVNALISTYLKLLCYPNRACLERRRDSTPGSLYWTRLLLVGRISYVWSHFTITTKCQRKTLVTLDNNRRIECAKPLGGRKSKSIFFRSKH